MKPFCRCRVAGGWQRRFAPKGISACLAVGWLLLRTLPPPASGADENPNTASRSATVDQVTVNAETDADIRGALAYLAARQSPNGSWAEDEKFRVAMTSYTLIGFMASGHLPDEGPYGHQLAQAVQFLLDQVQPDGILRDSAYRNAYMYSHGIATIALSELYGQTHAPALRGKLEKLVKVIVNSQGPTGGWRYEPKPIADADISVTVNELVALRAAKNGGFDVPQETIDNGVKFVRSCVDPETGGFRYQASSKGAGFARTAAAIYALQVCGLYEDPMVSKGSEYLLKSLSARSEGQYLVYGNYYGAPAEYMIGGESWQQWYRTLDSTLVKSAKHVGSQVYWDGAAARDGSVGTLYNTAVFAAVLAMPYHYIPLYQR